MAQSFGLSLRQFERRFLAQFGVTPKHYQRLARFERVLALIRAGGYHTLADLAARMGYYDQAHMIKDFKTFAGFAPSAFESRLVGGDPDLWAYRAGGARLDPL